MSGVIAPPIARLLRPKRETGTFTVTRTAISALPSILELISLRGPEMDSLTKLHTPVFSSANWIVTMDRLRHFSLSYAASICQTRGVGLTRKGKESARYMEPVSNQVH